MWGGNQGTFSTAWSNVPLWYKSIAITSVCIYILGMGLDTMFLVDDPKKTIYSFHFWRLFTACFFEVSVLNLLFVLISLFFALSELEKKYSTPYTILDFFCQNFLIQSLVCLIYFLQNIFFSQKLVYSYGLWSIYMIYLSRICYSNPDVQVRCWCFPFMIPKKYYPLVIFGIFSLIGGFQYNFTIAFIIGYVETKYFNNSLIKLPFRIVKGFQKLIPNSIVKRNDFIQIQQCKTFLKTVCTYSFGDDPTIMVQNRRPGQGLQQQRPVFSSGVAVDSNSNKQTVTNEQLRQYWQNKENNMVQPENIPQELYQKSSPSTFTQNDSNVGLGQDSAQERDKEVLENKKNKKNRNIIFY